MEATLNGPLGRTVLSKEMLKIALAPDNALVIPNPQSSRYHAEITPSPDGNSFQITDLGSTNGTFVNGQRLVPHMPRPLSGGDVIRVGNTNFTYEASGGYAPPVAASSRIPGSKPPISAAPPPQSAYQQPPAALAPPVYQQQPPAMNTPAQPPSPPPPAPGYPQPQASYPQPEGFRQPDYPPQKKRHPDLWITMVVIALVVLIGGGTTLYFGVIRSTPQKTLSAYCDGWKTGNAQEVYAQLDPAQQAKMSMSYIQMLITALNKPLFGGIKNCTVSNIQQTGSTVTADIRLTSRSGKIGVTHETMIQENGLWKIEKEDDNEALQNIL